MNRNGIRQEIEPDHVQRGRLVTNLTDRLTVGVGRSLTLGSLVYATWRFGAVETVALRDLSILLAAATICALASKRVRAAQSQLPVIFLSLLLIWILYGWLQASPLPQWVPDWLGLAKPHHAQEDLELLGDTVAELRSDASSPAFTTHFLSSIPEYTRQAVVPVALALMIAIVSALLFNTPGSRHAYMWLLVINGSALSFWGIVQRANSNRELLPGIEYDVAGVPFASFVYKNAGAAALLPMLAMIAALLFVRKKSSRERYREYQNRIDLFSARNLTLISFAALITAGLIATLSRGAWVAAIVAATAVACSTRFVTVRREHWLTATGVAIAILGVIALTGVRGTIWTRAEDLSIENVSGDQRWDHWTDGWHTAVANLPLGSGMGTYGFASLPHQQRTYRSWFDHAHNQFLEVFTEAGVVGFSLLAIGIGWFAMISLRLLRERSGFETRQWGLIGLAILACGFVQSIFDFVLLIPANLLLYASLIGIIGAVPREHRRRIQPAGIQPKREEALSWAFRRMNLALWSLVAIAVGIWGWHATTVQLRSDEVLRQTALSQLTESLSQSEVAKQLRALDDAIAAQPCRAELYKRRANWHLVNYRRRVIEAGAASGVEIPWANTQPEVLHTAFGGRPPAQRSAIRRDLLSSQEMMDDLAETLADLGHSLACNPFMPRTHLQIALLAPIVDMPVSGWTRATSPLVNNSSELLFSNGLIAFYDDDLPRAVDQWQKSLSINHQYVETIFSLATTKLAPQRVAKELVPSRRPDLMLRLVDATSNEPEANRIAFASEIIAHLESTEGFDDGQRHATIAQIHQRLRQQQAVLDSWQRAVQARPRDLRYRYRYATALRTAGHLQQALDQASLAHAMDVKDERFEQLMGQIRREIGGG